MSIKKINKLDIINELMHYEEMLHTSGISKLDYRLHELRKEQLNIEGPIESSSLYNKIFKAGSKPTKFFRRELEQRKSEQRRLKHLKENSQAASVYYWVTTPVYYPLDPSEQEKPRYIRTYRGKKSRYVKKYCNKVVRNSYKNESLGSRKGQYRKIADFWWILY